MNSQTIVYCVVSFLIGMLLAHMLKGVCGCKTVEGQYGYYDFAGNPCDYHENLGKSRQGRLLRGPFADRIILTR